MRTRPTPNADPTRQNIVLKGPRTVDGVIDAVKQKLAGLTVRKNAVLGCESVISASPEYFRPDDPKRGGYWHQDKLDAWREAVEPWITEKFPHAVSVVLHLDEETPHYQIITVPIDDKGKLNYRGLYGGDRQTLRDWQTEAAKPVAHLGIERGREGSKAEHVPLKQFYARVNSPDPAPLPKPIRPPEPLPPASFTQRIPGTDAAAERKALEQKHQQAEAAAKKRLEERKRAALKAYPVLTAKAKVGDLTDKKIDALEREAKAAKKASEAKDAELQALRAEANKLRALPIGDVLERLYGGQLCDDSKPEHKTRKYLLSDGQKSVFRLVRLAGRCGFTKAHKKALKARLTLSCCWISATTKQL